ncbi:hypothetical protein SARC_04957 [Sphaeroforma arctica JP610]|uniref:inorganic diphosphatase n=1 Tax=Sphaeroforma arctica JP610 TaxID=667725 RepID=A0A0L0G1Q3_9EUKA|nr:hypothetical protein SARC_04957 [Sphaeroforma arctica JP610]KNC82769.1 hypothetical protein SARC_04957 [Sphaeroforma arctica JP610]|eukprot:XP_014156671.1 hypothetical protein SARC_04957 [Sphaeroforma arctica JP610]
MLATTLTRLGRMSRSTRWSVHRGLTARTLTSIAFKNTAAPGETANLMFEREGKPISPWHDIPLSSTEGLYNMVTEIPKGTNAKMEICTDKDYNPIVQDYKNGKPRFLTHGNVLYNYGALPQTWEDPEHKVEDAENLPGDNDPLDIIDIGSMPQSMGTVSQVKVLGVLGLIDEGECDWKVLCINHDDPLAKTLHDIDDVEEQCPGVVKSIMEWYRDYKIVDGKPQNRYAFDGIAKDKAYAEKVIAECHGMWRGRQAAQK